MSESIVKAIGRAAKTMALLSAVVFLLYMLSGCSSFSEDGENKTAPRRPARKRAYEYSRIPANYPASWQMSTVGN